MQHLIYEDKANDLSVVVQDTAPQAAVDLLKTMVWGTNGPRYTKRGVEDKVEKLINPHFFLLKKAEEVIGICALSERQIWLGQEWTRSYYVRHFCMNPSYQGKGYSKLLVEQLETYFTSILPKPYVGYAFIEGKNIRSNRVARFINLSAVRMFDSVLFSRLFPKQNTNVRQAKVEEYALLESNLKDFYRAYNFAHFTKTFYKDQYYVYEEAGEIVAGVQAHLVEWKIHQLNGGWSDKILLNLLPKLPLINRLFHPEYKFVSLDSIFYPRDRPELLLPLLEGVLAIQGVYSALMMFDQECVVYADLKRLNKWGLVQKIQKPITAAVVMNTYGFSASKQEQAEQGLVYIASFDCL